MNHGNNTCGAAINPVTALILTGQIEASYRDNLLMRIERRSLATLGRVAQPSQVRMTGLSRDEHSNQQ